MSAICLIGFLLTFHVVIYFLFEHLFYVFLSAAILLPSLAQFFLPARYALRPHDITVKTPFRSLSRSWIEFQRCEVDRHGVFLSPFKHPSRLENFRGIYLRFGQHREEVLYFLQNQQETLYSC